METLTPLAHRMRPTRLADVVGQGHLLGADAPLAKMVAQGFLPSVILYGRAGVGKTTIARLLAQAVGRECVAVSALNGVKELKEAMNGGILGAPVVFVDEIHRFNKAQQDTLLSAVENGQITLIGATTENPSFAINNALLSRCQVYELLPLTDDEMAFLLERAVKTDTALKNLSITIKDLSLIVRLAQGDARKALNLLELCVSSQSGDIVIDNPSVAKVGGQAHAQYDKAGDHHYDVVSAFIKSVRGSDADASLYWLARMLVAGEDPAFIARRLVILASEDIGLANPNALLLADTALRSVQSIGMPEARIILGQVAVYLATSPKSNSSYKAINTALAFAKNDHSPVPLHLRNAPTNLAKQKGYGANYVYPHDCPNHYYPQRYLPDGVNVRFYTFGDNQKEQANLSFIKWLTQSSKN